jgi:hypothetical protein
VVDATTSVSESTEGHTRHFGYVIKGQQYTYSVDEISASPTHSGLLTRALDAPHHCRLIVGDPVKYAQKKSTVYVVDADAKECKLELIRQERTSGPRQ